MFISTYDVRIKNGFLAGKKHRMGKKYITHLSNLVFLFKQLASEIPECVIELKDFDPISYQNILTAFLILAAGILIAVAALVAEKIRR